MSTLLPKPSRSIARHSAFLSIASAIFAAPTLLERRSIVATSIARRFFESLTWAAPMLK